MTTERFTYDYEDDKYYDKGFFKDNEKELYKDELLELLNTLHEENQHLRRRCGAMQEEIEIMSEENEQLTEDKDDLIDFIKKEFPKSHKHILEDLE